MAGRQRFYSLQGSAADLALPAGCVLERFRPKLTRLRPADVPEPPPLALQLFWHLASQKSFELYVVRCGGAVAHTSYVLTRNLKFAFMQPDDVVIGPCWTHGDFRGRGIYPAVLGRIARDYDGTRLWIFCDEDNVSSRKGIERAGFAFAGTGRKRLGVYSIEDGAAR